MPQHSVPQQKSLINPQDIPGFLSTLEAHFRNGQHIVEKLQSLNLEFQSPLVPPFDALKYLWILARQILNTLALFLGQPQVKIEGDIFPK